MTRASSSRSAGSGTSSSPDRSERRPVERGRLGLRARVTAAFALGALSLSAVLSIVTYGVVRGYLLQQREQSAASQAFLNARVVRDALSSKSPPPEPARVLSSLETPAGAGSVVRYQGVWYANSVAVGTDVLPVRLRTLVIDGTPARQRFTVSGEPWIAVGVPIPRAESVYFEASSLDEIDSTLEVLALALAVAAFLTTIAGAAVGRWAAARVLSPLSSVSTAAAAIAAGNLAIRLEAADDRDLRVLTSSFNRMVDALRARVERDARFASDVSHELRSPLTTLATSLEVLQARRDDLPDRARAALDLLAADVRRFNRMVEDLLEISRFDAGVAELHLEPVDVAELVRRALTSTTSTEVPVETRGGDARAVVDKRRLERVIANLVQNAEAYGDGVTRVAVENAGTAVRIAVEDAGPGVPPSERESVFERFFRGSASGRRGTSDGSGLGLSLVAEHVRLHGGRVWVESPDGGRGARFVVELPVGVRP